MKKCFLPLFVITLLITSCDTQARRIRMDNEIRAGIENDMGRAKYSTLKGSFSVREMKKIAGALSDGEIGEGELNDRLRQKMIALGNEDMFEYGYR